MSNIFGSYICITYYKFIYVKMRKRISKGTLVASTNPLNKIKSKRLIIEVIYNFKKGVIKERAIDVRETINQ